MSKKYLCFDIGGTRVKYGVLDDKMCFQYKDSYRTRRDTTNDFVADFSQVVFEITQQYTIEKIGISFPGFINPQTGYAQFAGAFDILHGNNIKKLLSENVEIPIVIENDANCATLAEKLTGNAVGCDNFICLTIGTGIGGGIFVNGKIVNGSSFKAGEFGLMIVDGMENGYQNLHSIASTSALIQQYKTLKDLPEAQSVKGEEVFSNAKNDAAVARIMEKWFDYVSYGIFNLAATLNPEKILIGGAISSRTDLYTQLTRSLDKIPSWKDIEVPIEPCRHLNDAGMLGALYKCMEG